MAPKTQYTKEYIIDTAFELAAELGLNNLTVRKLAEKLGCSVAPIYVNFKNTEALSIAIIEKSYTVLFDYMKKDYSELQFFNMGIGQILFAKDYPKLFIELSILPNADTQYCLTDFKNIIEFMRIDPMVGGLEDDQLFGLLEKMSLITFAIAFRVAKGDIDLNVEMDYYINLIHDTGYQLIYTSLNHINSQQQQHIKDLTKQLK